MTDTVLIALIACIPSTLVAAATFVSSIRNGNKVTGVQGTADQIHIAVNGNLAELKKELAELRAQNESLRRCDPKL